MVGSMGYRLKVEGSESPHMTKFIAAMGTIQSLNDNRGYHHIAGFHGAPGQYCWHHQYSSKTHITARLFLPWHRAYLYHLEQNLKDIDPSVSLPWWDWTAGDAIPEAYNIEKIDNKNNPLYSSEIKLDKPHVNNPIHRRTRRNPGNRLPAFTLPVADVNNDGVATLKELTDYLVDHVKDFETFSDILQSVHDSIHGWIGGDMASVVTAAYDPIFFAHHCMIDRIWYLWQMKNGTNNIPTALLDYSLNPFGLTVRQVLNVQELGYEYGKKVIEIGSGDTK